jgi:mRNA interferase MazF
MSGNSSYPKFGDIFLMKFDGQGCEQTGWRPGLVFQNNAGNKHSPNIIALPLTSNIKKPNQPTHVLIKASDTGLLKDSVVLCENPERMSKQRIGEFITSLSEAYMKKVAEASLLASSAISHIDIDTLLTIWEKANILNRDTA